MANPGGVGQKVHSHAKPCLEFEVSQERRAGKEHGVEKSKIHFNADSSRTGCDISVEHMRKWALKKVDPHGV